MKSSMPVTPEKLLNSKASAATWPVRSMAMATDRETIRLWAAMMPGALT